VEFKGWEIPPPKIIEPTWEPSRIKLDRTVRYRISSGPSCIWRAIKVVPRIHPISVLF